MSGYDELSLLYENAREAGLPWPRDVHVRRESVGVAPGRRASALVWGEGPPELVLLHGGAQNAHTWDTVALALDRPLVALDLPGHGHSDWRADHDYRPAVNAGDVEVAVRALAPAARCVVGMSLGGLTALALAARAPDLVRRLVLVDITPGVDRTKAAAVIAFVAGPQSFPDFDAIVARTIEHNPTRSESSLRRGVRHNAVEHDDGSWTWRYDRLRPDLEASEFDFADLWRAAAGLHVPVLLVRGGDSPVVDAADLAELRRQVPDLRVEVVDGAGHSVQGDRPLALAGLLESFLRA